MDSGILQRRGNLSEIQVVFSNHLFALLELDPSDVFSGRNLKILVEQNREVAGAHAYLTRHHWYGKFLADMSGDILLCLTNDFILILNHIRIFDLASRRFHGLP